MLNLVKDLGAYANDTAVKIFVQNLTELCLVFWI